MKIEVPKDLLVNVLLDLEDYADFEERRLAQYQGYPSYDADRRELAAIRARIVALEKLTGWTA